MLIPLFHTYARSYVLLEVLLEDSSLVSLFVECDSGDYAMYFLSEDDSYSTIAISPVWVPRNYRTSRLLSLL